MLSKQQKSKYFGTTCWKTKNKKQKIKNKNSNTTTNHLAPRVTQQLDVDLRGMYDHVTTTIWMVEGGRWKTVEGMYG